MSDRVVAAPSWGRTIAAGIGWGALAALIMGMFAMIAAATYQKTGFFTPLHHIASTVTEPKPMMRSMEAAKKGDMFVVTFGVASIGMLIHLFVGAAYGVAFTVLVRVVKVRGAAAVVLGMIYGIVVMLFSSYVGLPLAAQLFGGGDPISSMPKMVGWTTFTIEHLMYGAVLGVGAVVSSTAFVSAPEFRSAGPREPASPHY